jgi:hypothetical protein
VETDGATLMVPARADARVDATLTCGLPEESIVTLGTDARTPGEAVTTCIKHQHFILCHYKYEKLYHHQCLPSKLRN